MVRFHLLPPTLCHGGITQLVEWLLCKQHVAGSNPTTSTNIKHRLFYENIKINSRKLLLDAFGWRFWLWYVTAGTVQRGVVGSVE